MTTVHILYFSIISSLAVFSQAMTFPNPPVFPAVQHYPSICYLPPDSGLCTEKNDQIDETSEMLIRYYFDITTDQCYPFGVQNCGGNENRFHTRSDCQSYCKLGKI